MGVASVGCLGLGLPIGSARVGVGWVAISTVGLAGRGESDLSNQKVAPARITIATTRANRGEPADSAVTVDFPHSGQNLAEFGVLVPQC